MGLVLIAGVILGVTFSRSRVSHTPSAIPTASQASADAPTPSPRAPARLDASQVSTQSSGDNDLHNMEKAGIESQRQAQSQHQAFANRYAEEPVDASWAGRKEATMLAASKSGQITLIHAEPKDLDIDCKTSLCRIQADFATRGLAMDWFTLFSTNVGGEMPNSTFKYSTNPDGSWRVTIYGLSRK